MIHGVNLSSTEVVLRRGVLSVGVVAGSEWVELLVVVD